MGFFRGRRSECKLPPHRPRGVDAERRELEVALPPEGAGRLTGRGFRRVIDPPVAAVPRPPEARAGTRARGIAIFDDRLLRGRLCDCRLLPQILRTSGFVAEVDDLFVEIFPSVFMEEL